MEDREYNRLTFEDGLRLDGNKVKHLVEYRVESIGGSSNLVQLTLDLMVDDCGMFGGKELSGQYNKLTFRDGLKLDGNRLNYIVSYDVESNSVNQSRLKLVMIVSDATLFEGYEDDESESTFIIKPYSVEGFRDEVEERDTEDDDSE